MPAPTESTGWITCPCQEDANWEASTAQYALSKLENLSAAGLRLILHRQPRPGMLLSVEFLRAPKVFSRPVTARVTHVYKHTQSGWLVDCEFLTKFTDAEFQAVIAPPPE